MTDGRITDPQALRALSHPTRWKLIELLGLERTATATRCAEYSGESVASCSYHLNMLAKYGFVEHASGGQGREKPWKLTNREQSWSTVGMDDEAVLAGETLTEVFLDHETAQVKEWRRRASRDSEAWQQAANISGRTAYLTADELTSVRDAVDAVLEPFRDRLDDPAARPSDSRAVRLLLAAWLPRTSS